jgi:hypothetical protein
VIASSPLRPLLLTKQRAGALCDTDRTVHDAVFGATANALCNTDCATHYAVLDAAASATAPRHCCALLDALKRLTLVGLFQSTQKFR